MALTMFVCSLVSDTFEKLFSIFKNFQQTILVEVQEDNGTWANDQ
jgi:hypothetical protein